MLLVLGLCPLPSAKASWWKNFCEKHLVQNDPYQYRELSVDQLVIAYFAFKNTEYLSEPLINEIKMRIQNPSLPRDDREILTKLLNN